MLKYFVWIAGLRGPEPQVWAEKDMTRDGKSVPTLAKHQLTEAESWVSLKSLAEIYPFEAKT